MTVPLLDAVINETMRLHPPVPSGTQRVTPPEGLWIKDRFIPGNTIVQVPSYTVFRDERAFLYPNEFIPERWTTRPELILDKSVYIPFNTGTYTYAQLRSNVKPLRSTEPRHVSTKVEMEFLTAVPLAGAYACVGKRLAMLELRRVIAEILSRYDLTIAPGQTKEAFLEGKQDTFTTVSAPLPIIFTERSRAV